MNGREGIAALVLAAGRGIRLQQGGPKAFVVLAGQTLLERSIRALAGADVFGRVQPVVPLADLERLRSVTSLRDVDGLADPVVGGEERQDSMRAGLESLPPQIEWVAVHDAARCLVAGDDVRRVVSAARATGAAILAERARDTWKLVSAGRVVQTPPREACWAAQTPQVFRRDWLMEGLAAAARSGRRATDDAQLVEWLGREIAVVEARRPNPKITLPEDLVAAEAWLAAGLATRRGSGGIG